MPSTIDDLSFRLSNLGLFDQSELRDFLNSLPESEQPKDAEGFLQALVRGKRLTTYQALQIGAGQGQNLVLGNYVILDKLGQGGMGEVFKAQHLRMQRVVALKLLSAQVTRDPAALKRFQREVVAAARLVHPNIVTAYDADEAKGTHFLIMEHVAGRDLARLVKETGTLSAPQAVRCILQAAKGLEYAHANGVIHRDVKPSNLLLEAGGAVKVLDLGLARLDTFAGNQDELTWTGDIFGTVDYMAPEQAENTKLADARSDVYSLGMSLWFLLTGKAAYDRDSLASKIVAHRTAPIPSLIEARPEVTAELNEIFQKLVAKDPRERYQTMTEAIAALEGQLSVLGDATRALTDDNELTVRLASINRREEETVVFVKPTTPSTHRLEALEPTLQMAPRAPAEPRPPEKNRTPLALALAFVGGAAMILLTVFLLMPNRGGNVMIEVTDSDVELTIDQGKVKIVGAVKQKLSLAAGEHDLAVKRGETALAEKFVVAKGKGTTLLIEVVDGVLQVKQDGKLLGSVALAPPGGPNPAPVADARHILEFAPGTKVEIASLKLDRTGALTLEAFVTPSEAADAKPGVLLGTPLQFALHLDPQTNGLSLESNHTDGEHRVGPIEIAPGRRLHVAAVRAANEHRIYVEGILVGRQKIDSPLVESEAPFTIGSQFAGSIEEVRVSTVERYEQGFTPAQRFEPDAETMALYHITDGSGEELVDASENKHTGQIEGATWRKVAIPDPDTPPEKVNSALEFDGKSSVVDIESLRYSGQHPLTVEGWVNHFPVENTPPVFFLCDETSGQLLRVSFLRGGRISAGVYVDADGKPETDGEYLFQDDTTSLMPGNNHFAACWSPPGELTLFVNGKRVGKERRLARKWPWGAGTLLGAYRTKDGTLVDQYAGRIDELRVSKIVRYDKEFSPERRFEPDDDTMALYHFDENVGNVLSDASGNNLTGRIEGARWVNFDIPPATRPLAVSNFALSFDGQGDIVYIPTLKLTENIPTTMECWARPRAVGSTHYAMNLGARLVLKTVTSANGANSRWNFSATSDTPAQFYAVNSDPFASLPVRPVHVAGVYDGRTLTVFVDGKRQATPIQLSGGKVTPEEAINFGAPWPNAASAIGSCNDRNGPYWTFDGELDEIRVSKIARYDQDFTPQRRFETDADTVALYHFDEGSGAKLLDSSGNEHHGKIVGARWVASSQMEQDRWELTRDLLQGIDLAQDGLVHDKADDTWKPGAWQLTPEGLKSGSGRHEIFRMPVESLPPSYSLRIDFEPVEVDGSLLVALDIGPTKCYFALNGDLKGDQRQAGIGDIDGAGNHKNETTVLHAPCKLNERHLLQLDVINSGEETEIIALLDGKRLTAFKGKTTQLSIKGFQKTYDDQWTRVSIGSMLGNYLFRRVELRTDTPAKLSGAARDHEIAAWELSRGGKVGIERMSPDRWQFVPQASELPRDAFLLRQINFEEVKDLSSAELARLGDADRVVGLYLEKTGIDDSAIPFVKRFPSLRALSINGTNIKSSSLSQLGELRNLNHVRIAADQIDDQFAFGGKLPRLRMLTLTGAADVNLSDLAPLATLREVHLIDRDSVDAEAVAALQKQNPLCRVVSGNGDQARSMGVDPTRDGLRRLTKKGVLFHGTPYRFAAPQLLTEELLASEQAWFVDTAEVPSGVVLDDEERELFVRSCYMCFNVYVAGQPKSDELARRLAENTNLTRARFTDCDFSDAGLRGLEHLIGLHELNVSKTRVTREAIDAFRAAVPACQVVSDFGTFPPSFAAPASIKATQAAGPQREIFTNRLGMKFAKVPKGKRLLGGGGGKPGDQEFEAKQDFYLGTHEVTQAEWEAVMGVNPSHYSRKGAGKDAVQGFSDDDLSRFPVENVSWIDIQKFLVRLGERTGESGWEYRLPTQAEWEYACREGPQPPKDPRQFFYYLDESTDSLAADKANVGETQLKRTGPVESYPANRLGLFDMHGNVGEWTEDPVSRRPQDAAEVSFRMSLGGGLNTPSRNCTAASRWRHPSTDRLFNLGFRLARVPVGKSVPPVAIGPFDEAQAKTHQKAWASYAMPSKTTKAGSYPPNPFGLYDMSGNIWEWCADWFNLEYYATSPPDNPPGPPEGKRRILRGGAWGVPAVECRSAFRGHYPPEGGRNNSIGFRVACETSSR